MRPIRFAIRRELKGWFYTLCQFLALTFIIFRAGYDHLPAPGIAIAILAGLAALMSVHSEQRPWHKPLYFILMAFLLTVEFRAIRKDRDEANKAQIAAQQEANCRLQAMLNSEKEATAQLITQENMQLSTMLQQDQGEFTQNLNTILTAHREDEHNFSDVLQSEKDLFHHEEELAESLSGRLIPANDPMPENRCSSFLKPSDVLVRIGIPEMENFAVVRSLPATVLAIPAAYDAGRDGPLAGIGIGYGAPIEPIFGLARLDDGTLVIKMTIRSSDHHIIAKLDENGFVVNRNQILEMKRDEHSLRLVDDMDGEEIINIRYLNPRAISVQGKGINFGTDIESCLTTTANRPLVLIPAPHFP
jgi:hypothetical protein